MARSARPFRPGPLNPRRRGAAACYLDEVRWKVIALAVAATAGVALFGVGLGRGWWRMKPPEPGAFPNLGRGRVAPSGRNRLGLRRARAASRVRVHEGDRRWRLNESELPDELGGRAPRRPARGWLPLLHSVGHRSRNQARHFLQACRATRTRCHRRWTSSAEETARPIRRPRDAGRATRLARGGGERHRARAGHLRDSRGVRRVPGRASVAATGLDSRRVEGASPRPARAVGGGMWQFDARARLAGIGTFVDLDVFRRQWGGAGPVLTTGDGQVRCFRRVSCACAPRDA